MILARNHLQQLNGNKFMRGFKLLVIVFFVFVATSCGQQKKYISYSVKKGETMKKIAKRLDMKTRDLLRLNPDVGRRPKPNTVIIIPNKDFIEGVVTKEVVKEQIDSTEVVKTVIDIDELKKTFVIHEVIKGDTYYSLTRAYNVSEEELKSLNPELEVEGMKLHMILKIKPIVDEDEIVIYRDTIQENASVRLAMMLPFRAVEYDTIDSKDIFKTNTLANITTDLYLGATVAIDSLRSQGINVDLSVFDTGRKDTKLDSILAATDFNDVDAIIGPLYSEEVPKVANRAGVPVIFPVYSKSQMNFRSSRVIKTYADKQTHQNELMNHILEKYSGENILIIGDSTANSIRNSEAIQSILLKHDSIQETKIIHPNLGYIRKDYIINALKAEVGNWVILATDQSVIASDVINSLISLPTEEPEEEDDKKKKKKKDDKPEMQILPEDTVIKVFAFDKSRKFDGINSDKLAKLGFTFTCDIFIDENSPAVQIFNKQYLKKNKAYPSYYATKGFDIVYDTAMRLASGDGLKSTFKKGTSYRLESKFEYSRKLFSTSSNDGIFIIQYNPDLTLTRLK